MKIRHLVAGALFASALQAPAALAATELSMWYHGAGNEKEKAQLTAVINDYNSSQSDYTVVIKDFPQDSYNESITAAALAGDLPDIIDVDGPIMPNWAWSGYLAPLEIDDATLANVLPGAIGRWDGKLYSVGLWDAACAIYARKSVLEKHGIRIPAVDSPWSMEEFDAALVTLQKSGEFDFPLDLGLAWKGEWFAYAFGPLMQSAGGDLFSTADNKADGTINGDGAVKFANWWQSVFERKLAPGTSQDGADRDTGFLDGKYALQLNGNWAAIPALEKFGDDMLYLPSVDFGTGSKIGSASWQFGVAATSKHKEAATGFIKFMLQDKYFAAFSDTTGLLPPTAAGAEMSEKYRNGGPLEVFFSLSEAQATLRAVTPGYGVASSEFEKAMSDIANGGDVQDALDAAADAIDADIEKNGGYK